MYVRVRIDQTDTVVNVESKLIRIDKFRKVIKDKFGIELELQRLFYGGKLLEDGYTFHDYNIKLNDVIQLIRKTVDSNTTKTSNNEELTVKDDTNCADKTTVTENKICYIDAKSRFYNVGDLIDMRDGDEGTWYEGQIHRIVYDTEIPGTSCTTDSCNDAESGSDIENDLTHSNKYPQNKQKQKINGNPDIIRDNLLYVIKQEIDPPLPDIYCKINEIRPRARRILDISDVCKGETVMINHNIEDNKKKGYWYDFKIKEIKKDTKQLIGTLYFGREAVPQDDTEVIVHDDIFAIEEVIPVLKRTEEIKKLMTTPTAKRSLPWDCQVCKDKEGKECRECGCFKCGGKENPDQIVLCDECDNGYHIKCLSPPITEVPDDDWYCPSCKRDTKSVVAPGASKQMKKASTTKRDWGRGMACVGKTKTCVMPLNHFGPIPGIEVGMTWKFRIQLSELGVHRPPVSGIHGRDTQGAYSIVLSGGYEDDYDNGYEFTYTGSGGRNLSGNKRTAEQSSDQTLTRENKALARNCAVKEINQNGADAGENWRNGKPVRVVRSYKMLKHFPKYAPKEGIRYDGIYKVVKYYPEKGLSGYRVWKYLLKRDDPSPAPWEADATKYPVVYPDGYLEAEEEKKSKKAKRPASEGNLDNRATKKNKLSPKTIKTSAVKSNSNNGENYTKSTDEGNTKTNENVLNEEEIKAIEADTANIKLWEECMSLNTKPPRHNIVERITELFRCIICQEVVANPVTTHCLHNFCEWCLQQFFKKMQSSRCPCCRDNIEKDKLEPNKNLKFALQLIMPGYDAERCKDIW